MQITLDNYNPILENHKSKNQTKEGNFVTMKATEGTLVPFFIPLACFFAKMW